MSEALEVVKASELDPTHVGRIVAFSAEKGVETSTGAQVGLSGSGAGRLLGYFVMADEDYVSLAIEGYQHHIAVGNDDQVVIHNG